MKNLIADTVTGEQRAMLISQFGTQLLTGDGLFLRVSVKADKAYLTTYNGMTFEYRWENGKWTQ